MLKKKCPSCAEKIERKFSYCPWCGHSFKKQVAEEDFGMLGKDDEIEQKIANQIKLPFGMNGIFNGLIKQLEKELSNMENPSGMPKGFKIQISTGKPQMQMVNPSQNNSGEKIPEISEEENFRRSSLDKVEAKSVVRRLPEGIFYEIDAPGIKSKKDVAITKLEQSTEIKAYSKDKCYVKSIPLKVEILGINVKDDKIFLRLKG